MTAPDVVGVALSAPRSVPVVIRRCDDTPMTRLRSQVRRAAKTLNVAVRISIVNDNTMTVLAGDKVPDDHVRRAMDAPDGI